MNTIRDQIIDLMAERVGASRRLEIYDTQDLPITVLAVAEETATEDTYGRSHALMTIVVATADGKTGEKGDDWYKLAEAGLGKLIVDAHKPVEDEDEDLEFTVVYTGGTVQQLTDGASGWSAEASFEIRYAFLRGDPFHQYPPEED